VQDFLTYDTRNNQQSCVLQAAGTDWSDEFQLYYLQAMKPAYGNVSTQVQRLPDVYHYDIQYMYFLQLKIQVFYDTACS
jgi:hypothetical protein